MNLCPWPVLSSAQACPNCVNIQNRVDLRCARPTGVSDFCRRPGLAAPVRRPSPLSGEQLRSHACCCTHSVDRWRADPAQHRDSGRSERVSPDVRATSLSPLRHSCRAIASREKAALCPLSLVMSMMSQGTVDDELSKLQPSGPARRAILRSMRRPTYALMSGVRCLDRTGREVL